MLKSVKRPDGETVSFEYDPLGRRISKTYKGRTTRWVWDGNNPLHEWTDEEKREGAGDENLITWLFEEGSFVPTAKIVGNKAYSIITDYLGTPTHAFDSKGDKIWKRELDIYGKAREGDCSFIPFLFQGQYFDAETGLCYNRFRYYSPDTGSYISQDPIGLMGNNPTIYAYVSDVNSEVDILGLFFGKIIGSAQSTGTFGHAFVSKMYAQIYSLNPNVKRVTMDLGYKRLLGGGNFKYGPRPDVGILYKDGTVKIIEVASKTDVVGDLISRNERFMRRNNIDFNDIKVSRLAQFMEKIKSKFKPKC